MWHARRVPVVFFFFFKKKKKKKKGKNRNMWPLMNIAIKFTQVDEPIAVMMLWKRQKWMTFEIFLGMYMTVDRESFIMNPVNSLQMTNGFTFQNLFSFVCLFWGVFYVRFEFGLLLGWVFFSFIIAFFNKLCFVCGA